MKRFVMRVTVNYNDGEEEYEYRGTNAEIAEWFRRSITHLGATSFVFTVVREMANA